MRVQREYAQALFGAGLLVAFSFAFGHTSEPAPSSSPTKNIRLAYFPNLTHAPVLIAVHDRLYERAAPGYSVSSVVVNAGPEAMEALLAGDIDMACVGPSPALNTYLKSGGNALKIVGGICSGGASLMARKGEAIRSVAELGNKRVAVPEFGGTQDVSLRHFLSGAGLASREMGGTVEILPLKNPDIFTSFKRGQLDAAWVPEPWASRLEIEAGATRVVDERYLWPGQRFTTAVLVARSGFLAKHPDAVAAVERGTEDAIAFIQSNPRKAEDEVNAEIGRLTGKPLGKEVLDEAWPRLGFSAKLDRANLAAFVGAARDAGFIKSIGIDLSALCQEPSTRVSLRTP